MDANGITNQDHILIYAKEGSLFTPRTWFLFKTMGHDPSKIHLLQGSLEQWIEAGGNVDGSILTQDSIPCAKDLNLDPSRQYQYKARDAKNVYKMPQVLNAVESKNENFLFLDPRGSSFESNGHIPNAIHLPYSQLTNPENALQMKSIPELQQLFQDVDIDINTSKTIICTCGSGVSVCHLMLALEECGRPIVYGKNDGDIDNLNVGQTVMYDGSWEEWGSDESTPKVMPQIK